MIGEEAEHTVRISGARLGLGRHIAARPAVELEKRAPDERGVTVVALVGPGVREVAAPVARRQNGAPHAVGGLVHDDPRRARVTFYDLTGRARVTFRIPQSLPGRHGRSQPRGPAAYDRNRLRFAHAASIRSLPNAIYARIRPTDQPEVDAGGTVV